MKHLKRCLALMVAAALALTLLAGCDTRGGKSSRLLLEVLMDQVENVSVATDPDFDRALKAAVQRGGGDPDKVLSALADALGITAPLRFSVSGLGSGNAGQQGLNVMFLPGTNPNAAAGDAAAAWLSILRGLEGNGGAYSARASLVEVNGGYILAIGVKVEQPGDAEDEPEPATLTGISVSGCKTDYFVGQSFDPTGMTVTAKYSDNSTKTIEQITSTDPKGVSWSPDTAFDAAGKHTVTISYGGKTTTVTVNVQKPTVDRIEVTTPPSKTTYTAGESFSPAGMVVTAYYSDNIKTETISSGYTITDQKNDTVDTSYQFTTAGDYTLTVEYQGKTDTIEITVNPAPLTDIEVEWPTGPYSVRGTLNISDITVTAKYSDGSDQTVSNYILAIKDPSGQTDTVTNFYTFATKGTYTLTVEYQGVESAPITITVEDKGYIIEENGTYKVHNADGLKAWAEALQSNNSLNITLTDNIDLSDMEWTPIGTKDQPYTGTFDGDGKTISGLTINQSAANNVGLFAFIDEGGTVKDLTLEDVNITAGSNVGAIAGENRGTTENCSVSGSVTGMSNSSYVGGIAGWHRNGNITDCHSAAAVKGVAYAGGIAGQSNASITGCYSTGDVTAAKNTWSDSFAGGVVGLNSNGATLTACYATGNVTGTGERVGGVVGDNVYSTVTACYHATGSVTGASGSTGGVVGQNYEDDYGSGTVTACYWDNNQSSGIGEDQGGTGEATKVDGTVTWKTAVEAMNAVLSGTGWRYKLGSGDAPLTLQKQ